MIDNDIVFDFIQHKKLKVNERVVHAGRKVLSDSITGDYCYNKIVTIDDRGYAHAYVRDLQSSVDDYILTGFC